MSSDGKEDVSAMGKASRTKAARRASQKMESRESEASTTMHTQIPQDSMEDIEPETEEDEEIEPETVEPNQRFRFVLTEVKCDLIEAKKLVAIAIADEKRLHQQVNDAAARVEEWRRNVLKATRVKDDELAAEALAHQKEHEERCAQLKSEWHLQREAVEKLRDQLSVFNRRIEKAKHKNDIRKAAINRINAQQAIDTAGQKMAASEALDQAMGAVEIEVEQVRASLIACVEKAELLANKALPGLQLEYASMRDELAAAISRGEKIKKRLDAILKRFSN
jgi:phage shock protein A